MHFLMFFQVLKSYIVTIMLLNIWRGLDYLIK